MDIPDMLGKLAEAGLSQQAIADKVGTKQPTIHRALKGADIRYRVGKRIEQFFWEECGQDCDRRTEAKN